MKKSPLDIEIRKLQLSDIPAIFKIEKTCFPDPWSLESFRAVIPHKSYLCLGAYCDSLIGYMIAARVLDEIHIFNIAIEPEFQRSGVGGRLLKKTLETFSGLISVVYLEVRISNRAAIAFYEKWGFRGTGMRKGYYRDGESALLMTLYIGQNGSC